MAILRPTLDTRKLREVFSEVFTPSSPVTNERLLVGRQHLCRRMAAAMRTRGRSIVAFGNRAVGKTSLCKLVARGQGRQDLPFYRSLGPADSFELVIYSLFDHLQISPWWTDEVERTESADKGAQVGIAGTGGKLAHHSGSRRLIRRPTLPVTPDQLADKLSSVAEIAIIDGFDRASQATGLAFSELIKKLSDHESQLILVLTGVADRVTDLVRNYEEVERHVEAVLVEPLTNDDLAELIELGLREVAAAMPAARAISITPQAREQILRKSHGMPHLVHRYCADCGDALCRRIDDREKDSFEISTEEIELAEADRPTVG